jgi:ribosomal protein S14
MNTIYTEPQADLDAKLKGPIIGHVHESVPIGIHKTAYYATKPDVAFPEGTSILCLQKYLDGSAVWIRWPKSYLRPIGSCQACGTPLVTIKGLGVCPKEFSDYVKKNS